MFNDSNVANRSRHFVRGRVLGFTTSRSVEFLTSDLTHSIPLYHSNGEHAAGEGLTFFLELNGFLTFDEGSEVKLIEVGPFSGGDFDPAKFKVVKSADPHTSVVYSWQVTGTQQVDATYYVTEFRVYVTAEGGYLHSYYFNPSAPGSSYDSRYEGPNYEQTLNAAFPAGKPFRGPNGYRDLKFVFMTPY